jgi:hypothetical protein
MMNSNCYKNSTIWIFLLQNIYLQNYCANRSINVVLKIIGNFVQFSFILHNFSIVPGKQKFPDLNFLNLNLNFMKVFWQILQKMFVLKIIFNFIILIDSFS